MQGLQLKLHLKLFIYVFSECIDLMFAELPYKDYYYQESLFLFQHSRCFSPDFLHNCPILSGILSLFHHFLVSIFLLPLISLIFPAVYLKLLGPIDRKFNGQSKNDEFVLYEYIIKQCSSFCKYTNISVMKKKKCQIK